MGTTVLSLLCLLVWGRALADQLAPVHDPTALGLNSLIFVGYAGLVVARGWWWWRSDHHRAGWHRMISLLYWGASLLIGAEVAGAVVAGTW
ncbi:MAG TPA: hypothetical protein VGE07_10215 [Herpetosiphonaceae bacterium]